MNKLHNIIINEKRIGYAYYQILCNELDAPIDFKILETNEIFNTMFGLSNQDVGKLLSKINSQESNLWISEMIFVAKNNETKTYCRLLNNVIHKITIFRLEKEYLVIVINDITGVEKMLYDNERSYKMIVHNLSEIIWIIDFDFIVTYINKAIENKIGSKPEKIIGHPLEKIIPSEALMKILEEYRVLNNELVVEESVFKTIEIEHLNRNEETLIYEYTVSFLKDEMNQRIGIIGIGRDVTEEKLIKRNLKDSEAKFQLLMSSTVEGIFGIDCNGICTFCNESGLRLLGFERQNEILGENMCLLISQSSNNDCIFSDLIKNSKNDYRFEYVFKKKNGEVFNAECHSFPQYVGEEIVGYLITYYDITDRIEVESELKESIRSKSILLSNLPGMAFRRKYDKDWTMLFISKGCYNLTEYNTDSLVNNKEICYNDLVDPQYQEPLRRAWGHAIDEGVGFDGEYQIITASGKKKWVLERGQTVYNKAGEIEALEGLVIDISELKQTQEEITYLSYHDNLTGLFNRLYFEMEKNMTDKEDSLPLSIVMGDINGLKLINDSFGHFAGDKLIIETSRVLDSCCREFDTLARIGGDEFAILMPKTTNEEANKVIENIHQFSEKYNNTPRSDAVLINISLGCATKTSKIESLHEVQKTAEDYMYKLKLLERTSSHSAIVNSIKSALFEKHHETEEHVERLKKYSLMIGKYINLSKNELDDLALFATLHDIGKVGISNDILNKASSLNEKEWEEIRKHPEAGYRIAKSSSELLSIADLIIAHHERWDGKGYPQKLKGREIPLLSRILSVVDAYESMTSNHPYRVAMDKKAALEELRQNSGTQFDPSIVKIFMKLFVEED